MLTKTIAVSRVKKIVQLDDEVIQCSNNATFVITAATVRDEKNIRDA